MTPADKTWESNLKNWSITLCHREIFLDWGEQAHHLTCREALRQRRGRCRQMSSVWEAEEMSRCAGGAGTRLHRPSHLAIGQKSWQLLALKRTENTPCDTSGRWGGGLFCTYLSKISCIIWSLNPKAWRRKLGGLGGLGGLSRGSKPVCSCVNHFF